MFPSQSVTITKDLHSGTFGLFSATTTVPRLILYTDYNCNPINRDNIVSIGLSISTIDKNIITTEGMVTKGGYFMNKEWAVGTALYWSKPTNADKCYFTVTYIDVASTTTEVASTTYPYSYHDWLFVSGVQIFFLSFICIAMIFSTFTIRK